MKYSHSAFVPLYILILLLLFFTKVYKQDSWRQSHDVTPHKDIRPPNKTPETQIEFHDVTPENHTEIHNETLPSNIESSDVTPQQGIEKALVVVTKTLENQLWTNDVDPSWTKYTYLVTEDSLPSHSNATLSVPLVRTPFPTTRFHSPETCPSKSTKSIQPLLTLQICFVTQTI